ncbi:hypothetical protein ACNF49_13960 [Actinomadura sp. ATCC 39365]
MPDLILTWLAIAAAFTGGTWFGATTAGKPYRDALQRLLTAAADEDARDLDAALAHADAVLERRPT